MEFHQTNNNAGDVVNTLGGLTPTTEPCLVVTVRSCQRCGNDHVNLSFVPLDNPADEWDWWAMCPIKAQPILLKVNERTDQ